LCTVDPILSRNRAERLRLTPHLAPLHVYWRQAPVCCIRLGMDSNWAGRKRSADFGWQVGDRQAPQVRLRGLQGAAFLDVQAVSRTYTHHDVAMSRNRARSACVQAEARGTLQVLLAIREANPTSELRNWWQGANYTAWRGVKTQGGEVTELCGPACGRAARRRAHTPGVRRERRLRFHRRSQSRACAWCSSLVRSGPLALENVAHVQHH